MSGRMGDQAVKGVQAEYTEGSSMRGASGGTQTVMRNRQAQLWC